MLKMGTPNNYHNVPHIIVWRFNAEMHPNDADEMANSEDPNQTAPKGAV